MRPSGNLVASTICRTAEIGVTITAAADAGTFHPHRRRPGRARGTLPRLHPTRETFVITLSADWLTCRSCGCHPPARSCPPDSPAAINNVGGKSSQDFLNCANDGATLTHRATGWILQRLAIDRMSVAATAQALGVGWELVNQVAVGRLPTARLRQPLPSGRGAHPRGG